LIDLFVLNATFSNISADGFTPGFLDYKKGASDPQPQVIKFTSCLPMVGGSLTGTPASSTIKTGRHDIAEILLKVALSTNRHPGPFLGAENVFKYY
jgi:hypothetical protein